MKDAERDGSLLINPPRIIDGSMSGAPGDYESPEMGLALPYARIAMVPTGALECHHIGARHTFDLHGDATCANLSIDSDRLQSFQPMPDSVGFIPSDCSLKLDVINTRPTFLTFVDPDWMASLVDDAFDGNAFLKAPLAYHRDPEVDTVKQAIMREALSSTPDRLAAEAAVTVLCLRIAEMLSKRSLPPRASQRLHASIFRAVELAEANLGTEIGIAPLAREAGLSHFHFIRIFKDVIGETPFAYIRRRRLERAMAELRTTMLPIADIAAAWGFAHQSHLTEAMRVRHQVTPAQYRASFN